ncbi:hypothetical protein POPTR_015G014150v4 [Populus trichocarpa]|uniref:Uncharacterized protein n=1 Tax=Populus trichocarpa TaxID=3694 RepID=A0A3N7FZU2_POPTR|nr:hypothetical protein BDE02_15G012700 [Populus trichocarpa]RQP00454.1 hypothetical protein POPTR_015G014150v4 [Populus trichocarpa]
MINHRRGVLTDRIPSVANIDQTLMSHFGAETDGQTSTRKRGQNFMEQRGPGSSDQLTREKADLYHDLPSSESWEEEE